MFPVLPVTTSQVKSSNSNTVQLWNAMPGRHRGETVSVSANLMNELRTAQSVIDVVKENLSSGTGNQKTDFMLTQGQSYQRTIAARHVRDADFRGDNQAIVKSALAARAGNCGEQSALAMAYLSNMELDRPIFTLAAANHPDHQLNVIGDLREPRKAVIVDSWPVFARAHLADNAALRPDPSRVLDVHYPGSPPKMDLGNFGAVERLNNARVAHINQQRQTPSFDQTLANPSLVRLEGQTHSIRNLGVRYQNKEKAEDVQENTAERTEYERQAGAMRLAQRYFPDTGGNA